MKIKTLLLSTALMIATTMTSNAGELHTAVIVGDVAEIFTFLERGLDIEVKDNLAVTALHWTVTAVPCRAVTALLDTDAR